MNRLSPNPGPLRSPGSTARSLSILLGALSVLLGAGCGGEGAPAGDADRFLHSGEGPVRIVATVGMVADLARNVGGDRVEVVSLMGEGVDPHLYKASPGDMTRLGGADMILYVGLHLEGKMADVLAKLARTRPAIAVGERLPPERLRSPPEMEGAHDPHVWFDVSLWSECAAIVRDALSEFDPAGAESYRERAEAYRAELAELESFVRARVAEIPEERRILVTAHDAFGYFGAAYGIEVMPIQGASTETEAGVRRINDLVEAIVARGVPAVFVESSVSEKNVRALVEGCEARGHKVRVGGELFSDAMGAEGTPEGTYVGMVRHNADTVAEALR